MILASAINWSLIFIDFHTGQGSERLFPAKAEIKRVVTKCKH